MSNLREVVAYRWVLDGCEFSPERSLDVSADDLWPGRVIADHKCIVDHTKWPVWQEINGEFFVRTPTYEVLSCGHERPVDEVNKKRTSMYMRARRRCVLCSLEGR